MAPLMYLSFRKLLFVLFLSAASILLLSAAAASSENELQRKQFLGGSSRRKLMDIENDQDLQQQQKPKNKTSNNNSKNQTKQIRPTSSSNKNQTKLTKTNTKNQTKLMNSTTTVSSSKKLNSLDPIKLSSSPKNRTTKPNSPKQTLIDKKLNDPKKTQNKDTNSKTQNLKHTQPTWLDQDETESDDLVSEFRDLPIKFQQTLLPDLEKISITSKAYINKYNKEITKGFKPIVGHKYAATIASLVSFAFILIPLILVSLIFNHFKAYFSFQKILIFIQVYLSIYFSILCLSSLVTGLEPLKFFYSTSQFTYVCVQVMQTLGYILYLLLLLMYLILVFSTVWAGLQVTGLGPDFCGLCCWFALLRGGASQGVVASTAQD